MNLHQNAMPDSTTTRTDSGTLDQTIFLPSCPLIHYNTISISEHLDSRSATRNHDTTVFTYLTFYVLHTLQNSFNCCFA